MGEWEWVTGRQGREGERAAEVPGLFIPSFVSTKSYNIV